MSGGAENVREVWPTEISGVERSLTIVFSSAFLFYIASLVFSTWLPQVARKQSWRWKNISVSCLHSCISGIWAVLCFYQKPEMAEDLISTHPPKAHTLVCVSIGYFLYDIVDMLVYKRSRQSLELILHHVVIVIAFGIATVTMLYVGYAVVALIVELNSIFLHIRQLLQIYGYRRQDPFYRVISILNLGTFIGFRVSTLAWMTRWIVENKDRVPLVFYSVGTIGLAIIMVMNIILFYRLLSSDFLRKKNVSSKDD